VKKIFLFPFNNKQSKQRSLQYEFDYSAKTGAVCGCGGDGGWGNFVGWVWG
jgi:hypothetical protein